MPRLIAACLALASLSLLLPSEPSYDPWAWLVWGRELAHLEHVLPALAVLCVLAGAGAARTTEAGAALGARLGNRQPGAPHPARMGARKAHPRRRAGYGHRVVFRTRRELLAGKVPVWGRARERRRVARAGTFEVHRRMDLSYRLFTRRLQGFHIPPPYGRNVPDRVVTR
jgi:hypothetical protein